MVDLSSINHMKSDLMRIISDLESEGKAGAAKALDRVVGALENWQHRKDVS